MVRDDEIDLGTFELDPCNLRDGEAEEVASRLAAELAAALRRGDGGSALADWRKRRREARIAWPD